MNNKMILNNKDIGISKIELNKSDLLITDKTGKYTLHVTIYYNWKEINNLKVGEEKNINFNEYILTENNEPVLIWPNKSLVNKISDDIIYFNFSFNNITNNKDTCYMNKRGCFDILVDSLEITVSINYQDVSNNSIMYKF